VLRVDRRVALLLRAKLVDEVAFPEVQVGDLDQVRVELAEQTGKGRRERAGIGLEALDRAELDLGVGRGSLDLGEEDAVGAPARLRAEALQRPRMLPEGRLEARDGHGEPAPREREPRL